MLILRKEGAQKYIRPTKQRNLKKNTHTHKCLYHFFFVFFFLSMCKMKLHKEIELKRLREWDSVSSIPFCAIICLVHSLRPFCTVIVKIVYWENRKINIGMSFFIWHSLCMLFFVKGIKASQKKNFFFFERKWNNRIPFRTTDLRQTFTQSYFVFWKTLGICFLNWNMIEWKKNNDFFFYILLWLSDSLRILFVSH